MNEKSTKANIDLSGCHYVEANIIKILLTRRITDGPKEAERIKARMIMKKMDCLEGGK
jgi:hypothetical protein